MRGRTLRRRAVAWSLAASALLAACSGGASGDAARPAETAAVESPPPGGSAAPAPSPPPGDLVPTTSPPSESCVNGWQTPPEKGHLVRLPVRVIRRTMDLKGPLVVTDLRYFEGPESPPSRKDYLSTVRRWYVKAYAKRDPSVRGRFLVEERVFGAGVAAVAPWESTGFRSPDWVGFQYEAADAARRAYPGLPGRWAGEPYDFVEGVEGLTIAGLPKDVVGCLEGT